MKTKLFIFVLLFPLIFSCQKEERDAPLREAPESLNLDFNNLYIVDVYVSENEIMDFNDEDYWDTSYELYYHTRVEVEFAGEYEGTLKIEFPSDSEGDYTCRGDNDYYFETFGDDEKYWAKVYLPISEANFDYSYTYYARLNEGKISIENLAEKKGSLKAIDADKGTRKVTFSFERMINEGDGVVRNASLSGSFEYESEFASSGDQCLIGTWVKASTSDCPGNSWMERRTFNEDGTSKVEVWDCNMACPTGNHILWHMVDWEVVDGQLHLFNSGPGYWCGYQVDPSTSEDYLDFECDGDTLIIYGNGVTSTFTRE
jgi:hypothetical protein